MLRVLGVDQRSLLHDFNRSFQGGVHHDCQNVENVENASAGYVEEGGEKFQASQPQMKPNPL